MTNHLYDTFPFPLNSISDHFNLMYKGQRAHLLGRHRGLQTSFRQISWCKKRVKVEEGSLASAFKKHNKHTILKQDQTCLTARACVSLRWSFIRNTDSTKHGWSTPHDPYAVISNTPEKQMSVISLLLKLFVCKMLPIRRLF